MQEKYSQLNQYAMIILHDRRISEELVMDTFHEAVLHIDRLMKHPNPSGWLIVVLRNKIGDYITASKRKAQLHKDLPEDDRAQLPDTVAIHAGGEAHLLLLALPQVLSEEEYRLFSAFLGGATYLELAKEHKTSVWNCRKRIQRIREKLRLIFPEYKK